MESLPQEIIEEIFSCCWKREILIARCTCTRLAHALAPMVFQSVSLEIFSWNMHRLAAISKSRIAQHVKHLEITATEPGQLLRAIRTRCEYFPGMAPDCDTLAERASLPHITYDSLIRTLNGRILAPINELSNLSRLCLTYEKPAPRLEVEIEDCTDLQTFKKLSDMPESLADLVGQLMDVLLERTTLQPRVKPIIDLELNMRMEIDGRDSFLDVKRWSAAEFSRVFGQLHRLSLRSYSSASVAAGRDVARMLHHCSNVQCLELSERQGFSLLKRDLSRICTRMHWKHLKEIVLREWISSAALIAFLQSHPQLRRLTIEATVIEDLEDVLQAIRQHENLKYIWMWDLLVIYESTDGMPMQWWYLSDGLWEEQEAWLLGGKGDISIMYD